NTEAALRSLQRPINLVKHPKYAFEFIARDANTRILYFHHYLVRGLPTRSPRRHLNAAPRFGVLACIVYEIAENLCQTHRVSVYIERLGRQVDNDLMLGTFGQRTTHFDGLIDH